MSDLSSPPPLPSPLGPAPADPVGDLAAFAFRNAPGGLALLTAHGRELAVNNQWGALLGDLPDGRTDTSWTHRLPSALRDLARSAVEEALAKGDGTAVERLLRLPGSPDEYRTAILTVRALGSPGRCIAQVTDAEHDITDHQGQLGLTLLTASLAAWRIDLASGDEHWFDGSQELHGIRSNPAHDGRSTRLVIAPEHHQAARDAVAQTARGTEDVQLTYAVPDNSGRRRWMRTEARVHMVGALRRRWLVGVVRDITDEVALRGALEEEAEAEADRAEQIEEVAGSLVAASTTSEVASAITDRFHQGLDAIGALVMVPEKGVLQTLAASGAGIAAGQNFSGIALDGSVPLARVVQRNQPFFIRSHAEFRALSGDDPHNLLSATACQSWAMLPLQRGDAPPGVLSLGFAQRHAFTPKERAMLLTLAGLTSQALERSALVQDQIDLAQAVQRTLMPDHLPQLPGLRLAGRYVPACDGVSIGGDWYEAFPLPGGRYGLTIGDVEGHDVRAAATMGQVRTALRAYAQTTPSPGTTLAKANNLFCSLSASHYTTCMYVVIDPERGELEAATAGHPPAVLGLAHGGGTELLAPPPGPPIGVEPGSDYLTVTRPLAEIHSITLLSDGLVEGPRTDLESGLQKACAVVGTHNGAAPDTLADALLALATGTGHLDDAALLTAAWDG